MKTLYFSGITILLLVSITVVLPHAHGIIGSALFMKSNSTAKIYADYTFRVLNNETWNIDGSRIFTNIHVPSTNSPDLTIVADPNSFTGNKPHINVIYTITANGHAKGIYALSLYFCGLTPLVVGENDSQVNPAMRDFFTATYECPAFTEDTPDMNIVGYSRIISKNITVNDNNTITVMPQNMTSSNNFPQPPPPPFPVLPNNGTNNGSLISPALHVPPPPDVLQTLPPLMQLNYGVLAKDVKCKQDLQLVIKAEDASPTCVKPGTAQILTERGWALPPPPKELYINKIGITGLLQDYTVGQSINATVVYSGYYLYIEPEVKIFDSNGTQIWFNCPFCYARTEPIQTPSFGTFTYHVIEYGTRTLPMINKTGNYTMVASLENKTTEANFTIMANQTPENQNSNQTVSIAPIKQVPPVTPGGPTIQLTLKNISNKPITSLKATLELNNNYTFDFVNVTSSKPLVPNNSISETQILIGAGFQTDAPHPITITGTKDKTQFTYIENVYIQ